MTINLISNEKSAHHAQIEWDVLSQIITQFAYFERNKKELLAQTYVHRIDLLQLELIRTQNYLKEFKDDYRQIINQVFSKLPSDGSLEKLREHISKKGVLTFGELNRLARLIESAHFIKQNLSAIKLEHIQAIAQLDFQPIQRKFLKEFRYLVDDDGEVHFDRHPELSELTKRLRELEERIRRIIQEWINIPSNNKTLQFNSYDVIYDRYVVPVRSDSYRSDIGLIVSRSETGSTLFVEPFEVRDACNRRMELVAKLDELINQLAMKFSHTLFDFSDLLKSTQDQIHLIDFYLAKASFAEHYALECPVVRENPGFKFEQLFHPLIKNPIKNNAECTEKEYGIVISGPNTGGKTVFLKSLSLAYMLFYHGLFVPAAEAQMYPYQGLFYFGNDLQDLQVGLSSFSGEVKNYIELMSSILPSNLILIDEIFNSTSSDEASALSIAYFDELHKRAQCHIIVSTHHQMFKTLIHQDRQYISCHVGFDTINLRPTYKINWGTPGASMAIDIFSLLARGHETVSEVPQKALQHLSDKNISYETLLLKVSQKQIELDHLLGSNRQLEIELKNQKGAMEGVLNLKLTEELNRARREVDKILNEARELVLEARRQEITKPRRVDEKSHQLRTRLDQIRGEEPVVAEQVVSGNINLSRLKIGDRVFSHVLKKEFTVLAIDQRKCEVQVGKGPIKFHVPAHTLSFSNKSPVQAKVSVSYERNTSAKFEYDVRGMRLSECQGLIENALGDLLTGDIPFINVIHGHGDGVLKGWLRDYVKKSREFSIDSSESGNDGETRIILS
jgi:DNA mismatch repair protein MutS2